MTRSVGKITVVRRVVQGCMLVLFCLLPPPFSLRLFCTSSSSVVNTSQARLKGVGVFFSPMPMTMRPLSRKRLARRVKSESLDTRQKPSTLSV